MTLESIDLKADDVEIGYILFIHIRDSYSLIFINACYESVTKQQLLLTTIITCLACDCHRFVGFLFFHPFMDIFTDILGY